MRASILQSNYLPWRGVFDLIRMADVHIILDDAQYTRCDWRNRNRFKLSGGTHWLTVPVKRHPVETPIDGIEIDGFQWAHQHRNFISASLSGSPFYSDVLPLIAGMDKFTHLSPLNQTLIGRICDYLEITTPRINARDLGCTGRKTEKVLAICKKVGADYYVSGPAARQYLDTDLLQDNGISVEWKDYNYEPYPQKWGAFDGNVSVLDLIANLGPQAKNHIYSHTDY